MAETVNDLKDLKQAVAQSGTETETVSTSGADKDTAPQKREPKIDPQGRSYATGRRKDAVARVWIKKGKGKGGTITVNGKDQAAYFGRPALQLIMNQPFLVANCVGQFDVVCTVSGGGLSGQAGAIRHGISRALENFDPDMRASLKKAGMLTRDPRAVERKKIGKHKARRSKQWAKR